MKNAHETYLYDMHLDAQDERASFSIVDELQKRGAKRILDVATGTGYYSTQLLNAGCEVVSVGSETQTLNEAFDYALKKGHRLNTVCADWKFLRGSVGDGYDGVICMANAFASLFKLPDRHRVLAEFFAVLDYGGILCIEHRNYDAVLNSTYSSPPQYVYESPGLNVEPVFVDNGLVQLAYEKPSNEISYVNTYPILKEELQRLILNVGFQNVQTIGRQKASGQVCDFWVQVAEK